MHQNTKQLLPTLKNQFALMKTYNKKYSIRCIPDEIRGSLLNLGRKVHQQLVLK